MSDTIIELTSQQFRKIGFGEAEIFCSQIPLQLDVSNNKIVLSIWGMDVDKGLLQAWGVEVESIDDDYYLQGWSTFSFSDVTGIEFSVGLYNYEGTAFIQHEGKDLVIKRKLGDISDKENADYYVSAVFIWPYGFCEITIATNSNCILCLSDFNAIPLTEYVLNPRKYAYQN